MKMFEILDLQVSSASNDDFSYQKFRSKWFSLIREYLFSFFFFFTLQDYRISHIPTHALTITERETYKTRKEILVHVGTLVRDATIELERLKLAESSEEIRGEI